MIYSVIAQYLFFNNKNIKILNIDRMSHCQSECILKLNFEYIEKFKISGVNSFQNVESVIINSKNLKSFKYEFLIMNIIAALEANCFFLRFTYVQFIF